MASSISAGTTSATALVATADTTGSLILQTNNGTTALTLDTSQNATFAGTLTTAAKSIAKASLPAGAVLQVVSTTKTDTFSTSATSFTDVTGLSVSITPTSSTSKIFIILSCNLAGDTGAGGVAYQFVRGSTAICIGDTAGNRPRASGGLAYLTDPNSYTTISGSFLDSPATTASTTYKVQIYGNGSAYVNRTQSDTNGTQIYNARTASTITVMEIAA